MEIYKVENGCDIFSWCPAINMERSTEEQRSKNKDFKTAIEQMEDIARLPYVNHCVMAPDSHSGFEMPIGGICMTDLNVVVPTFVGFDISCGMAAMRTNLKKGQIDDRNIRVEILKEMHKSIPVSFHHNNEQQIDWLKGQGYSEKLIEAMYESKIVDYFDLSPLGNDEATLKISLEQISSMGGNNHFIELQYDTNGYIWAMIHSGSRGLGKKIGEYFNQLAIEISRKYYSSSTIGFLPLDTREGKAYWAWMNYASTFAHLSREAMMTKIKIVLSNRFPELEVTTDSFVNDSKDGIISIHHNIASIETHLNRTGIVHRKGATRAFEGQTGIIPSSMGTPSYIVKGKGKEIALRSCSHGTGRKCGRNEFNTAMKLDEKNNIARIEESLKDVVHSDFGVISRGKNKGMINLSEAPECYKDGRWVMSCQEDLVEVIEELHPMVCMKGLAE
jgi:tRNA-splicing ligase RtcB